MYTKSRKRHSKVRVKQLGYNRSMGIIYLPYPDNIRLNIYQRT